MNRTFPPAPLVVFLVALLLSTPSRAEDAAETTNGGAGAASTQQAEQQVEKLLEAKPVEANATADDETREALAHIEEVRTLIASAYAEAQALDADAAVALGDDAWALASNAIDLRLSMADEVLKLASEVQKLSDQGVDVANQRQHLSQLVLTIATATRQLFDAIEAKHKQISSELAAASAEDGIELQRRADQLDALIDQTLAASVSQIAVLDDLGHSTGPTRDWVAGQLQQRARLAAARIRLWSIRRENADAASEAAPEDTALAAAARHAADQFGSNTDTLKSTVSMMDQLDIDAAQYHQLVVESTGQITTDLFDRRVAGKLISRWTSAGARNLSENAPGFILKATVFVLLVTVFWWLSRFVRKLTQQALESGRVKFSRLLKRMITSLASSSVLLIGLLIGFSQLGIEVGPMLAGLGIAGFVLGFALQDSLSNFASGIMILAYRPYDVQDLIECAGGVFGRVSEMNLVSTTILTLDNQTRVVPNSKIWGDVITNVTAQRFRRVDMVFGISYADDIPKAEAVLTSILEEHPSVVDDPEYMVKVHELGDSSVNFVVRPWVARDDYWDVHWDVTREVKMRFDREGISIPFPQRDVHFYRETAPEAEAAPLVADRELERSDTELSSQEAPNPEHDDSEEEDG